MLLWPRQSGASALFNISAKELEEGLHASRSQELLHMVVVGSSFESNLKPTLAYLDTRLSLSPEQLRKVVIAFPSVLGLTIDVHIEPCLNYLETALGLSPFQLQKVCF